MAPVEAPLKCLAVCVGFDTSGQIDNFELEGFLNEMAVPSQWVSRTERRVAEPPAKADPWVTVPVLMPEAVAALVVSFDAANDPPRVLREHVPSPAETLNWRALDPQSQGRFPWEFDHA